MDPGGEEFVESFARDPTESAKPVVQVTSKRTSAGWSKGCDKDHKGAKAKHIVKFSADDSFDELVSRKWLSHLASMRPAVARAK